MGDAREEKPSAETLFAKAFMGPQPSDFQKLAENQAQGFLALSFIVNKIMERLDMNIEETMGEADAWATHEVEQLIAQKREEELETMRQSPLGMLFGLKNKEDEDITQR